MICQRSQLEPCHRRLQLGLVGGGFHQSNHRADRDRQESIVLQGEDEQLVEGVRALPSSKPGLHSSTTQSPHHHHHRPYVRSVSLLLPQSSFLSSWVLVLLVSVEEEENFILIRLPTASLPAMTWRTTPSRRWKMFCSANGTLPPCLPFCQACIAVQRGWLDENGKIKKTLLIQVQWCTSPLSLNHEN